MLFYRQRNRRWRLSDLPRVRARQQRICTPSRAPETLQTTAHVQDKRFETPESTAPGGGVHG